jgi:twinkle protein
MISAYTIEAVKQAMNVVEVVGDYVKLKKSGTDYEACCPFHNEKSPSFKVHPIKGIYKCFGCGTSGDAIEFVMKHQQKTYPEALEILAKRYNIPIEEDKPQPKRVYKRPQMPKFDLSPLALTYFTSRKISGQILADFKVTTKVEWMPKTKSEVECICFNYFRGGELINVKYRAKDKDFKLEKDAELIFYNLDSLKNAEIGIIVEGEIDALSVAESFLLYPEYAQKMGIVSVPNGANVTGVMKLEYLDNCYEAFEHLKEIIIFTDNDEAGIRLRDELGRRLGYHRCKVAKHLQGCKDANEVLVKHSANEVLKCITGRTDFPIKGIVNMNNIHDQVLGFYLNGYPDGYKTGIPNLDDMFQIMLGDLTIITGVPSHGKSEFTDYMMTELSRKYKFLWAISSFENQPVSLHATKIMQKYVGKAFDFRKDPENRMTKTEFDDAFNFTANNFIFIDIETADITIDGLLEKFTELVVRRGINGVLIDPWNRIESKKQRGQNEGEYINDCLTKVKNFAKKNNVHVFLIAHPTKMPKVNGRFEVPNMYSISGSANFYNQTDNGITVYRDLDDSVSVFIQKIRFDWLGKIGECRFLFDKYKRRYIPDGEPEPTMTHIPDNPRAGIIKKDNSVPF